MDNEQTGEIAKLAERIEKIEQMLQQPAPVLKITKREYSIADRLDAAIRYLKGEKNARVQLALGLDCWMRSQDCGDEPIRQKVIELLEFLRNKHDF